MWVDFVNPLFLRFNCNIISLSERYNDVIEWLCKSIFTQKYYIFLHISWNSMHHLCGCNGDYCGLLELRSANHSYEYVRIHQAGIRPRQWKVGRCLSARRGQTLWGNLVIPDLREGSLIQAELQDKCKELGF